MGSLSGRRLQFSAISGTVVSAALSEERLKKLFLGISLCLALFLVTASSVLADPIPCPLSGQGAGGAPTYFDLIATNAGGGCFIADKVFSSFTFLGTSSGTNPPAALSALQVSYTLDTNAPTLIGFEFAMALNASGDGVNDVKISYNVNQIDFIADITSIHNLLTGQASNGGSSSVADTYCLGAFNNTGCSSSGQLQTNHVTPHQDVFFSGVARLSIITDINAAGNGGNGLASISGVRNAVDETPVAGVPEPTTFSYLLGGAGLLCLGWLRRKPTKG